MVLSTCPRPAVRLAALAAAVTLAGCTQSLFDNRNGGGSGGTGGSDAGTDGPVVPTSCPAGCLGDVAADFDGTATGKTGVWRYLEDQGRAWKAMAMSGSTMMGQLDPANQITTCKNKPDAPACGTLTGALLMSSGASSPVDPAIEFTTALDMPPQVLQLTLRSYLASGTDQTIRVYRNSREDLLFSGALTAKKAVDYSVVVDALPGDRFLVAISGLDAASEVGLQFYVNATGQPFPTSCQIALPFRAVNGNSTPDPCSKYTFTSFKSSPLPPMATPMVLGPGPFMEQMLGTSVGLGIYLQRDGQPPDNAIDWKMHDVTVQLWAQPTMLVPTSMEQYLFSDLDPDTCGGFEMSVGASSGSPPHLNLSACIDPDPSKPITGFLSPPAMFPADGGWHFLRVVRNAAGFDVCIDGSYVASLPVLPGLIKSNNQPMLGKQYSGNTAFFAGGIDDVRVFTGSLPCR